MSELRDAATVLLLRDRSAGGFEVFMVRRHGASSFMGGAYVFPGGKLDEADSEGAVLSRTSGRDAEDARRALHEPELDGKVALGLFVSGVRETFEEAGVLLASEERAHAFAEARAKLHADVPFASVLAELDATLRLDLLIPLSRWVTPIVERRRFDTRFFVALAPDAQDASHDARETTEHAWWSPAEAIVRMERGEIDLPPPTFRSLQWLDAFTSADAVLAYAKEHKPPLIVPVVQQVEGKIAIVLPGDELHPEPVAALHGSTRLVFDGGRWWAK